jgi:hypothetical protein
VATIRATTTIPPRAAAMGEVMDGRGRRTNVRFGTSMVAITATGPAWDLAMSAPVALRFWGHPGAALTGAFTSFLADRAGGANLPISGMSSEAVFSGTDIFSPYV